MNGERAMGRAADDKSRAAGGGIVVMTSKRVSGGKGGCS